MKQSYYRHKLKNMLVINKIVTIHYLELNRSFEHRKESHDFWELVYVDTGALICRVDDKEETLYKGEIRFHKPNELHSHAADSKSTPHILIISFECKSDAMRFFEDKRLTLKKDLLKYLYMIIDEGKRTFDIPHSDPEIKKMPLHPQAPIGGLQLIKNMLEILLIQLMREETEKENPTSVFLVKDDTGSGIADRIKAVLRERIYSTVTVEEIAQKLNYNKSYLYRQFKAETGHTMMSYFTALKIAEAKKTLCSTNLTVAEIAALYAFDTPNYFSKTFKRITGSSPAAYRKIHKR